MLHVMQFYHLNIWKLLGNPLVLSSDYLAVHAF